MNLDNEENVSLEFILSEDRRSVKLKLSLSGQTVFNEELTTRSVEKLIKEVGSVRREMMDSVPRDLPSDSRPCDEFDPRWYVTPDSRQGLPVVCIRHGGYGWLYFGIPRHEAREISKYLRTIPKVQNMRDMQPPSASSIEGGGIFLSSHATGSYYIGKGKNQLEAAVFEQIEWDSDRSAGIVAASMLEQRTEEAIRSLSPESTDVATRNLFGGNSPLGAFAPKVDLARFLGLITEDAHADAHTIRKIRNDFAHNLQLDSFSSQSISDRCMNLRLIETHLGPAATKEEFLSGSVPKRSKHYSGRSDYKKILSDPRSRYVFTVHLICFALGQAMDTQENLEKPII